MCTKDKILEAEDKVNQKKIQGGNRRLETASHYLYDADLTSASVVGEPHAEVWDPRAMLDLDLDQQEEEEAKYQGAI